MTATMLVVDDDAEILDLMRDYLSAEGYHVVTAPDGAQALRVLETTPVDGILLDVMMPGLSGFDVYRQMRDRWDLPVLFLSARQDDAAKLRGLGLGADDYIGKTSSPAEVVARVKAVLRRYRKGAQSEHVHLRYGRLTIDLTAHEVLVDGAPVAFTAKEFELLRHLAEHPRQVFTREQLVEALWDGFADPQAVNGLVTRIRTKIPPCITTIWGVGYRFEGERSR
jgi:DNA-binding response OmpR family regulator